MFAGWELAGVSVFEEGTAVDGVAGMAEVWGGATVVKFAVSTSGWGLEESEVAVAGTTVGSCFGGALTVVVASGNGAVLEADSDGVADAVTWSKGLCVVAFGAGDGADVEEGAMGTAAAEDATDGLVSADRVELLEAAAESCGAVERTGPVDWAGDGASDAESRLVAGVSS